MRTQRPNHVWSYDFMQDRTEDGRRFRMLDDSHGAAWLSSWRASSGPTTCATASPSCALHTGHGAYSF